MKLYTLCILALVLVFSSASNAELLGYTEARGFYLQGVSNDDEKYITIERLRPTFTQEIENVPRTSLTVTPQLYFQQGRYDSEIEEVDDYLTIERLYFDCYFERFDLRLGRQAVNWGSAQIWNPTDLFREFFLTDYWAERKGINAAKVFIPFPGNSWLNAVAATGDTSISDNRYGLKLGTTWKDADIAGVFMDDTVAERLVGGVDIKGQFEIGYWLEGAWFFPMDRDLDDHLEFVVGIDYSFPLKDGLIIAAQYYYDGSGERSKQDYDWMAVIDGTRFNLAQDYASLMATLAWNGEVSLSLLVISNLNDSTGIVNPYLNLLLPFDLQLNLGANLTVGPEGGEFKPGLEIVPESIYYLWLRWSF